jgi:hypothetical protein
MCFLEILTFNLVRHLIRDLEMQSSYFSTAMIIFISVRNIICLMNKLIFSSSISNETIVYHFKI